RNGDQGALVPRSEKRAPHPHMRGAKGNRLFKIPAHAHGKPAKPVAPRKLFEKREMKRGFFIHWRNAHQPFNLELPFIATAREKRIHLFWCKPRLLRLLARIQDRKSTRLNSSHVKISYAVFCL